MMHSMRPDFLKIKCVPLHDITDIMYIQNNDLSREQKSNISNLNPNDIVKASGV